MNNPSSNSGQKPQQPAQSAQPASNYSYPYYQPTQQSYPNYSYPSQGYQTPTVPQGQGQGGGQSMLPQEESYIENILRLNRGKPATVYMTFENNREWNAKIFKGIVEAAGRDHIILSDPKTDLRYILPMIYLDYITFEGEIQYSYPYNMTNYSPR